MSNDLITVATFMSNSETAPARSLLEAAGIRTYVQGGATGDILSHVGTALGGVKLQVAASDGERASELLGRDTADQGAPHVEWKCPQCGERVDAGFEICWSCGAEFNAPAPGASAQNSPAVAPPQPASQDSLAVTCPMCGARVDIDRDSCPRCGERFGVENHSRMDSGQEAAEIPEHVQFAREQLGRAFRASLIGTVLCPPLLNLYSIMQLVEYESLRREYQIDADWRLPMAYIVNGIVLLYVLGFILLVFR